MLELDVTICEVPILNGGPGEQFVELAGLGYWITIDGEIEGSVKIGSLSCELVLNGKSSLAFTLLNPIVVPVPGQSVAFINQSKELFGGTIVTVSLRADQAESVKEYSIECAGWEAILERHLLTKEYTNALTGGIIEDAITAASLNYEGFTAGDIDDGPTILFAKADHVRVSEFLRDIASAGGGSLEIWPDKTIVFKRTDMREAPFDLTNSEAELVETITDLDAYCNRMQVHVTGASSGSVDVVRQDPEEIAERIAIEGGTGIYEAYETVQHPTSNDTVELTRLGISTAFLFIRSRGQVRRTIRVQLRRDLLDVGQLVTINVPGMNAVGQYQISRLSITDEEGTILYDVEASYTNLRQLNLDSLLKVIQAAKATIVLPATDYAHTVEWTTPGTYTWDVIGTGTVLVECDAFGPGGGGGGGQHVEDPGIPGLIYDLLGGTGGPGGKVVSFREYTAGTTLTIVIPSGGVGGDGASSPDVSESGDAATGTAYVSSPTETKVAEAYSGGGGQRGYDAVPPYWPAANGSPGGGAGDFVFSGAGMPGGAGGYGNNPGASGNSGKVIIRY